MEVTETDNSGLYVAGWQVNPGSGEISRHGEIVKLEPRVMDLLLLLASKPEQVFTRNELEDTVWPGMVVSYDALTKSIGKLRDALGDNTKPFTYIQTVPKKGYRLTAPVKTGSTEIPVTQAPPPTPSKARPVIMVLAFVVLTIGITWGIKQVNTTPGGSDPVNPVTNTKPLLLVMPFKNLDGNTSQDYFSRGITDDLITDLSGYPVFNVVNSRTAFQFQDIELKTLAKKHNVNYVVLANHRKTPKDIRINVQLINAQDGINLWAEQFNQPLSSLFDIQDKVRSRIVSALSEKLGEINLRQEHKRYTNNFDAYDAFLRGQYNLAKRTSAEDNLQARMQFERAIALDPSFARAYSALAMANTDAYRHDWEENPEIKKRIALEQALHALTLEPDSKHTSLAMGYVQFFAEGNHAEAINMAKRTFELDPNNADANMLLAITYIHAGEYDKAEAYIESGLRLGINQSSLYIGINALSKLLQGDYQSSHSLYERSLQISPGRLLGNIYMTVTLVRMNKLNDARWYADEVLAVSPRFDVKKWVSKQPYKNKEINQQLLNDLNKAGLK